MDISVVTCHFGDPFWLRLALSRLDEFSDSRIKGVYVVDQDRSGNSDWIWRLPRVEKVIEFPRDVEQEKYFGCDHPASLNRALASLHSDFGTSHVMILDSDCFPISDGWLDRVSDVTLATEPAYTSLSHPCFMVLPTDASRLIDFSEGIAELGIDAGRLVASQLLKSGVQVVLTKPRPAFKGYQGHLYLDGLIYHHGHGSFLSSPDGRLNHQVNVYRDAIFRNHIQRNEFNLTEMEVAKLRVHKRLARLRQLSLTRNR